MSGNGQQARRRDPYPWTWELPVGLGIALLLAAALVAHLGRALANWHAGAGWAFPARADLFTSLPGVLAGHAAAGLPNLVGVPASGEAVLMWVAAVELVLLGAAVAAVKIGLDRWGPGPMRGMASRHEAETLLGCSRLRRHASIVRPDLYAKRRR